MPVVMDAERISRALTRIAHEILEHNRGLSNLALVGVRSRGVPIAQRIADDLRKISGEDVSVGALDITLYRDDLMGASVGITPLVRKRNPLDRRPNDRVWTMAVYRAKRTGRFDALTDLGPEVDSSSCLVDRGHRERRLRGLVGPRTCESRPRAWVKLRELDGSTKFCCRKRSEPWRPIGGAPPLRTTGRHIVGIAD